MKKWVWIVVAVIIGASMFGESEPEMEKLECDGCATLLVENQMVYTGGEEWLCGGCLQKTDHQKCLGCNLFFDAEWEFYDGYCLSCSEEETWGCSRCEEYQSIEDLAEVEPGYFLCASCVFMEAKPFDNAFAETFADYVSPFDLSETSPYVSRNEALGIEAPHMEMEGSVFDEPEYYFLDYEDGYDDGREEGYSEGYDVGYNEGTSAGYDQGHDAGYDEGYRAGHDKGYAKGEAVGYNEGLAAGKKAAAASGSSSGSSGSSSSSTNISVTVYVTRTGEKYHRSGCQYLRQSKIPIALNTAKARGYTACSRCW